MLTTTEAQTLKGLRKEEKVLERMVAYELDPLAVRRMRDDLERIGRRIEELEVKADEVWRGGDRDNSHLTCPTEFWKVG